MTPQGIFVTGTDTDAGKTAVTTALLAALTARGQLARGFKPFETDCEPQPSGGWAPGSDARRMAWATGTTPEDASMVCLPEPLAPSESARRAAFHVDYDGAVQAIRSRLATPGWHLIEGAGGLFVPLDDHHTWVDVLKDAPMRVLVVAGNKLGVINHTLLTVAALAQVGIIPVGVVLNEVSDTPPSVARQTNAEVLGRWLRPIPLIPFPFVQGTDHRAWARAGGPMMDALFR